MGKALYRKHRSRKLDEVVGQEHITDTLKNALKKDAISHAYLFTGPKGVGKTSVARILAHEINSIDYIDESIHLDIIEIDAASNRRIEEIRNLRDKVSIAPTSAKYKVYIIDEVHMLTREAFNALLKTLEEPPEHVVFILATTEAYKVPETIISRTQKFTFKPISIDSSINHLKYIAKQEKIKISNEALQLIAEHSQGSFRDSISMLDQLSGINSESLDVDDVKLLLGLPDTSIIDTILEAISSSHTDDLFEQIQKLRENGVSSSQAVSSIGKLLRNGIIQNNLSMPRQKAVRLLKELLPLTKGSDDYLKLELVLLDSMDLNDIRETKPKIKTYKEESARNKDKASKAVNTEKQKQSKLKTSEKSKEQKIARPLVESTKVSKEKWDNLLEDIKKKHNTLYGLLRMAKPAQNKDELSIYFDFNFHKKRLDEPSNRKTLLKYVDTHFGISNVDIIVSKKITKSKKPKENEPDDVIKNVSNIFKGAQLLES